MKIVNKFLVANIITGIISILILCVSIYIIVGDAITESLTEDLMFESAVFEETYINNSKNVTMYRSFISNINENYTLSGIHTLFLPGTDNSYYVVSTTTGFENEVISGDINYVLDKPFNEIYELEVNGRHYLAYNRIVSNKYLNNNGKNEFLLSVMSKEEVTNIKYDMYYILFIVVLISILVSANISFYLQQNINKPITTLLNSTKEIGKKNFDINIKIKTNDEFKMLGNSITLMAKRLKAKDIEQKQFYETLSHELKTPVAVISGYVQGLKSGIIEDVDNTYDVIIDECDRLKRQLENAIYLSKLDTLKDEYNFEKININEIIINSLNLVESVIIINEIDVYFEPIEDIFINVDKEKFQRAITNILYNCVKYTKDSIYIESISKNDKAIITISDNGEGFPEKLLSNPFDGKIIGDKEGTGIGLTIIKKIIDNHKGQVFLSNKNFSGAIYKIVIPKDKV